MKKLIFGAMIALALGALSFTRFGLDAYDVFLNDKMVMKGYVNQPLDSRILSLGKAASGDQLRVVYRHCRLNNGPGTGRHIALKDESGHALQQWDFADAGQMIIPVKDLLSAKKKSANHQLSLYYTAHELDNGQLLAAIRF